MNITRRTAIGVTLIVLIGFTSWGLAGTLEEQQYIDLGKAEYQRGNYDAAIYLFTKGIELNPDNHFIYNDRGLSYLAVGDTDKAISDFSEAIVLCNEEIALPIFQWYPYAYYAYTLRGACYYELGEYNKTIADFEKVIEEYESELEAHAYMYLGMAHSEAGNETEATAAFESAICLYNATIEAGGWVGAEAYNNRGLCYLGIEEYNFSIHDFGKVIELEPNYEDAHSGKNLYIEAHKNLGIAYSETGDKEKAREYFEEGLRLANEQGLEKTAKEIQDLLGEL